MKKIMTNNKKIILFILFALLIVSVCCGFAFNHVTFAASHSNLTELEQLCKAYTEDEYLYQEAKIDSNKIIMYENYLNTRFDVGNKNNSNSNVTDEWIFKIVPRELFEQQVIDFLYIGKKYGFYVDYNTTDNNFLVYLLLHVENDNTSGQYKREIKPLYYERYTYNQTAKTSSLIYKNSTFRKYYEKYSDVKNLYIKNVGFTGSLYNENHLNKNEEGYIANNDYGGYFFGSYYRFKGVSTQSGKVDFVADAFKILIGYVPLFGGVISLGDALNISDAILSLVQLGEDIRNDFRGEITNENDYGYKFGEGYAEEQINQKQQLTKDGVSILETGNTKEALLFGIRNGNYIQNTFFIGYRNQDNMWNTRFSGKIKLDIVEEKENITGSTLQNIATNVESFDYVKRFDNGEKTEIFEREDQRPIYILADSNHNIRFEAPVNGIYTIRTLGNTSNEISALKGELTDIDNGINKKLIVDLEKDEILDFCITKKLLTSANLLSVIIEFTPNEIDIGQNQLLEIQPGKKEYLLFRAEHKATPFEFNITTGETVMLQFAYNKFNNFLPNSITGNHLYGSLLADNEGKYYLIVSNTSDEVQTVAISLGEVASIIPDSQIGENILDGKVYEFSSAFTSSVKISVESEAPILMQVYDTEHNLLAWTSDVNVKQLICDVVEDSRYYLVLKNLLYTTYSMELSIDLSAYNLNLGNNDIIKNTESLYAKFSTGDTKATYKIQSSLDLVVYDTDGQVVTSNINKEYSFEANQFYYLYVTGSNNSFDISIDIISTVATSGIFPESGIVFVKYVPTRTTAYRVNGIAKAEWYNSFLKKNNAYLYVGNTYYLKLEGNPGEQYNVSILRNSNQIQPNTNLTIGEGLYFFYISERGVYTTWVTCPIEMSTSLTITDGLSNVLYEDLHLVNESYEMYFEVGLYYLDLSLIGGEKASLRIFKNQEM